MIADLTMYGRMAAAIWRFSRSPEPRNAAAEIADRLTQREDRWLTIVRQTVFSNETSPYHQMFRLAGISWQDLADSVHLTGLEGTLRDLYAAGIHLTHDELKGRQPIIRSGVRIPASERSFDNPLVDGAIQTRSSGSRSKGTRTGQSVGYYREVEAYYELTIKEFGINGRPFVSLWPVLPSDSGFKSSLLFLRQGQSLERWFATGNTRQTPWYYRWLTSAMVATARQAGRPVPLPEYLAPNDFEAVAEHLAGMVRKGCPAAVSSYVSPAVRVAAAAHDLGLRLDGTLFRVVGEALTPAKRAVIEGVGARVAPFYWITEVGPIGHSCSQMQEGNHVHVFSDSVAILQQRKNAPLLGKEVDALLFTTLSALAPRVLINADLDDAGQLGTASCNCTFAQAGFTQCIRQIESVGKVTGHGITLFGTDIVTVLERTLPGRFGGRTGDFQLIEVDGETQTEVLLRVSPRVALPSHAAVKDAFLSAVANHYGGSLAARQWTHMQALRVEVAEPIATETGKVLSLHLMSRSARSAGPRRTVD